MRIRSTQQKTSPLFPSLRPILLSVAPLGLLLLMPLDLEVPLNQSPLSLSPFLPSPHLSHLSHLACQMAPSQSHLQAGSHLRAITPASPFHLPLSHLLLLFSPHQLFLDPPHLWWCRLLFHLLCTRTAYPCIVQARWIRGILQGMAVHLYHSLDHPGSLHLFPGLTPLCRHQATHLCVKTLISSQ